MGDLFFYTMYYPDRNGLLEKLTSEEGETSDTSMIERYPDVSQEVHEIPLVDGKKSNFRSILRFLCNGISTNS